MRLAQDTARMAPRVASAPSIGEATAVRDGASTAATASEAVETAIAGDLIEASPSLRAKLEDIDERLSAVENPEGT